MDGLDIDNEQEVKRGYSWLFVGNDPRSGTTDNSATKGTASEVCWFRG